MLQINVFHYIQALNSAMEFKLYICTYIYLVAYVKLVNTRGSFSNPKIHGTDSHPWNPFLRPEFATAPRLIFRFSTYSFAYMEMTKTWPKNWIELVSEDVPCPGQSPCQSVGHSAGVPFVVSFSHSSNLSVLFYMPALEVIFSWTSCIRASHYSDFTDADATDDDADADENVVLEPGPFSSHLKLNASLLLWYDAWRARRGKSVENPFQPIKLRTSSYICLETCRPVPLECFKF